jgi:hypothetical protein
MAEASELPAAKPGKPKKGCGCFTICLSAIALILIAGVLYCALVPPEGSTRHARACAAMFNSSSIALSMYRYSVDHHGQYPTGKSSTEIFQKLIDEGYVNDPSIFLGGYPRSNEAALTDSNQKLKPENVGFDVTAPVNASSPSDLPVVFLTGYRITYAPGASASPLSNAMKDRVPCMAVAYGNKTIAFFQRGYWFGSGYYSPGGYQGQAWIFDSQREKAGGKVLSDGTVTNFIPSDFDPKGKTYLQLTPYGPLSP